MNDKRSEKLSEAELEEWRQATATLDIRSNARRPPEAALEGRGDLPGSPRTAAAGSRAKRSKGGAKGSPKGNKVQPEAKLDLHGKRYAIAQRITLEFVAQQSELGRRCVLIVTGRGVNDCGPLRSDFREWLKSPSVRGIVEGINQAQPADGGLGAWYVWLKRRRG